MPHLSRFFRNMRSRLKSTVSALNGSPSWKVTPRRSANSQVRSLTGFQRQRQPRHRLALAVDVDQALEHLADVVGADRAHADARVHVGRVVGEGDDQLGVGVDRHPVDAVGLGPAPAEHPSAGPAHAPGSASVGGAPWRELGRISARLITPAAHRVNRAAGPSRSTDPAESRYEQVLSLSAVRSPGRDGDGATRRARSRRRCGRDSITP